MEKIDVEILKKSYDNQCGPCMVGYPECGGDPKKARTWKCKNFYNGVFIIRTGFKYNDANIHNFPKKED